jgi:hypothetical protein
MVEQVPVDSQLSRAIASRKLGDWREEDHRGKRLLLG